MNDEEHNSFDISGWFEYIRNDDVSLHTIFFQPNIYNGVIHSAAIFKRCKILKG